MHPKLIPVVSSNIAGYRYIVGGRLLLIGFKSGTTYSYEDVPESVVAGFINAESKGKYFGQHIREPFVATKLEDDALENILLGVGTPPPTTPRARKPTKTLKVLQLKYPVLSAVF